MVKDKVIAVDLGGTNLRVSIVYKGKVLRYLKNDTPKTKVGLLKVLDDSIASLISKEVYGIGVGSPGPLENGIIKNPPNLPFHNFNLQKHLSDKFKVKCKVENDVKCVALSEARLGVKKKNFIVIAFGTGIGGGIIVDSKLYVGRNFAGELGHIVLDEKKYFEILWQESKQKIKDEFGEDKLMVDLFKMKNPKSEKLLDEICDLIGRGLGSLINVFDPEIIVLNGGMKEAGKPLLDKIKKATEKYSIIPHKTEIEWSKLDHPGTLGASLLVS